MSLSLTRACERSPAGPFLVFVVDMLPCGGWPFIEFLFHSASVHLTLEDLQHALAS